MSVNKQTLTQTSLQAFNNLTQFLTRSLLSNLIGYTSEIVKEFNEFLFLQYLRI
jgi:hypothetical protein